MRNRHDRSRYRAAEWSLAILDTRPAIYPASSEKNRQYCGSNCKRGLALIREQSVQEFADSNRARVKSSELT